MKLRHDPFNIFRASKTPTGLYARQKWLGESDTLQWRDDFQKTVFTLMAGQSADGSWQQSPLASIRCLFGLHLTLRHKTEEIEKALGWLMNYALNDKAAKSAAFTQPISSQDIRELPFTPGQPRLFLVSATLFLATVFERGRESLVTARYLLLLRWVAEHLNDRDIWQDKSNALRALIVHPDYAEDVVTTKLIDHLETIQYSAGHWPAEIPFYQMINALAHSLRPSAHSQWIKSLGMLSETQNDDGSWGNEDREWNTFLVVHALKKKACL